MKQGKSGRRPGSLQYITKRSKGREYQVFRWRSYRRGDLGWQRVDIELGKHVNTLRTRVLIALGDLSAPLLMERWARWRFNFIKELPAWTGDHGHQRAAWWLELPRKPGDSVKLRFRSRDCSSYDFRWKFHRERVKEAEQTGMVLWESLTDDPVLRLAELQWLANQASEQIVKCDELLLDMRRQRKKGDLSQRDYESDERGTLISQDDWQGHRADLERAWDRHLSEMVAAMPRNDRESRRGQIIAQAERCLSDGKQLARWQLDHWDYDTLRLSA